MAYPRFGLYQAVVTDNSEFYKRGYIRVRVSVFYSGNINWDLSQPYREKEFKQELEKDITCLVYTPIGGGNGHGMFTLPQVNSVGMVSFLNGDVKKAVWMGSFINPQFDSDGKFLNANVPNDDLFNEGYGSDGITVDGKNVEADGGALIIRQKSTGTGGPDEMNWNKNRTENLVVLSEDSLKLTHASKWEDSEDKLSANLDRYQEISIERDKDKSSETFGAMIISVKSVIVGESSNDKIEEFGLEIIGKEVKLKTRSSNKIDNTVKISEDNIELHSINNNTNDETTISQTAKELILQNKDANVIISKNEVNVFGRKKVTLSGDDIRLGGLAEGYVVTSNMKFSYRMEDGTILTSSHKARA